MTASPEVADFLGLKALAIVHEIGDPGLRARVLEAMHLVAEAFFVSHQLDLGPFELGADEGQDLSIWNALAPEVRTIFLSAGQVARRLPDLFASRLAVSEPAEPDLDLAFSLFESGEAPAPLKDRRALEIDQILESLIVNKSQEIGTAVDTLCDLLSRDLATLGQRLRSPQLVSDRWLLLGELHELRSKCTQCLEALAAALLSPLTQDDLEDMLPHYASAATRAVRLRRAVVDLAHAVEEANRVLTHMPRELLESGAVESLVDGLQARVGRFAAREAYRDIRPQDKHEIIRFRLFLRGWRSTRDLLQLRQAVEGFAKFLELMRAINRREELRKHDQRELVTALHLLEAKTHYKDVASHLDALYGRSAELDAVIRRCIRGEPPPMLELEDRVRQALRQLEG